MLRSSFCFVVLPCAVACSTSSSDKTEEPATDTSSQGDDSTGLDDSAPAEPSGSDTGGSDTGGSDTGGSDTGGSTGMEPEGGAARGAISLHVVPAGECALGDTWVDFPLVAGGHPVNAAEHSASSVDDTRDAEGYALSVNCQWLTLTEPVSAFLGITKAADEDSGFATLNPSLTTGNPSTGTIQFQRQASEPAYATYDPQALCQYAVIDLDVASGTVWGSVTCASIANQDESQKCAVSEGFFYFENCSERM
jgi:hypothetical protein